MAIRTRERQGGQMLVLFTLALVAIIAMVGLILDGGAAFAQRRGQQNAADLAALAGADALLNGRSQAQAIIDARRVAASNSYADGVNGITVTVTFPPNLVQVDVVAPHRNNFAGVVGQPIWQVAATAQAQALNQNPDTAYGAAPFILSNLAFGADNLPLASFSQSGCPTNNRFGSAGCVFGDGHHGDYPQDTGDFAWTLFGPNVRTSEVASYMNEIGYLNGIAGCPAGTPTVVTYTTNDYIGQQNQGNHNGAINQAGRCITGVDIPVPITGTPTTGTTCNDGSHTNGCFYGWAMFHVTGIFKDGNDSGVTGWFLDPPTGGLKYPWLSVTDCSGSSCPPIGSPILQLNLVN